MNDRKPTPELIAKIAPRLEIDRQTGCWNWTGAKLPGGYGVVRFPGRSYNVRVPRATYEWVKGPIPDGYHVDHLCRNPRCANPAHLEAVTPRENILRGEGPSARQARQTHCREGHPFDEANTYRGRGHRRCRKCHAAQERRRQARLAQGVTA